MMSEENFNELLSKVHDCIRKQDTMMMQAISPKLKLQVTLRYLATGDSFSTLASVYRVPKNTIPMFLGEVCRAIYNALQDFIKLQQVYQIVPAKPLRIVAGCKFQLNAAKTNIFRPYHLKVLVKEMNDTEKVKILLMKFPEAQKVKMLLMQSLLSYNT